MLTKKLLAAVSLAGALMLSLAAPAEARGLGGGGFHRGPARGGGFRQGPVYRGPDYGSPVHRGVDWRRNEWRREHGRFGYRY